MPKRTWSWDDDNLNVVCLCPTLEDSNRLVDMWMFPASTVLDMFLIYEQRIDDSNEESPVIIGFTSYNAIDLLKSASSVSIDGTFEICEKTLSSKCG